MLNSITQIIIRINTISSTSITRILLFKLTSGSVVDMDFLVVEEVAVVIEIDSVVDFPIVDVVDVNVVVVVVILVVVAAWIRGPDLELSFSITFILTVVSSSASVSKSCLHLAVERLDSFI